ncbi:hypothetical protein PR048_032743 [Dryococelus australis]|uniref:Uncharacterized protein n=1 Tax=Dryococelus australis TaxID=614101 RepID=A0ABQ9G796_9NEOP|nr:hypothetical protein PR048_032743 [Dryococelus australis]
MHALHPRPLPVVKVGRKNKEDERLADQVLPWTGVGQRQDSVPTTVKHAARLADAAPPRAGDIIDAQLCPVAPLRFNNDLCSKTGLILVQRNLALVRLRSARRTKINLNLDLNCAFWRFRRMISDQECFTLARAGDERLYAKTRLRNVKEMVGIAERYMECARVCEAELVVRSKVELLHSGVKFTYTVVEHPMHGWENDLTTRASLQHPQRLSCDGYTTQVCSTLVLQYSSNTTVIVARMALFTKKGCKLEDISPSKDVLALRFRHAIFQGRFIWSRAIPPVIGALNTADYDRKKCGGSWEPVWISFTCNRVARRTVGVRGQASFPCSLLQVEVSTEQRRNARPSGIFRHETQLPASEEPPRRETNEFGSAYCKTGALTAGLPRPPPRSGIAPWTPSDLGDCSQRVRLEQSFTVDGMRRGGGGGSSIRGPTMPAQNLLRPGATLYPLPRRTRLNRFPAVLLMDFSYVGIVPAYDDSGRVFSETSRLSPPLHSGAAPY